MQRAEVASGSVGACSGGYMRRHRRAVLDPCGDVRWRRRVATLVACTGRDMWRRRKWRCAAYAVRRHVVARRVEAEAYSGAGV